MAILATRVTTRPWLVTAAILAAIIPLLLAAVFLVQSVANQALTAQKVVRSARLSRDAAITLQLNEETGIRGFVATRDRRFLAPYMMGTGELPAALSELRAALETINLREAVAATERAREINAQWLKNIAAPILSDPNRGQVALQLHGKDLIDRYRAEMATISAALETAQEQTDARTVAAVNRILVVGIAAALAIVVLAVVYGIRQATLLQRLEESERRAAETRRVREFQTLGQAMEQMLWTARPDGTVDYYSDRWAEYAGIPTIALAAQGWMSLVHPDDAGSLEQWTAAVRDVTAVTIENRVRRGDGAYRWHVHRVLPIRDARSEVTAWFATSTDIDEQKHEVASLRAAYDNEKRIADTLQEALLQQALPTVTGLLFSATYVPASDESKVGGDWYDALKLPDGRIFFSMGDVAGHGLDAAIVMSRARQAIISAALHEIDPAIVLTRANTTLVVQDTRMVTAVCGYIDPSTFALSYAGAGHPPPVLVELGRPARLLQTGGLPLAVMKSVTYRSHRLNVAPGSLLVLYTDGAVEHSRDPLEGEAILLEAAAHAMDVPGAVRAETIHDHIFASRTVGDDVAIMTVAFGNEMVLPESLANEIASLRPASRPVRRVLSSPPVEIARLARA